MDRPLLAEVGSKPVGLAWVRIESTDLTKADLYQMWVDPKFRGCGIGRALLTAAVEWARVVGAKVVELGVTYGDTPAMRMYAKAGFEALAEPAAPYPGAQFLGQRMRLVLS
jgi:GNAT superfamily N-acetyltransferase